MSALLGFIFILALLWGFFSWLGDAINRIKRRRQA